MHTVISVIGVIRDESEMREGPLARGGKLTWRLGFHRATPGLVLVFLRSCESSSPPVGGVHEKCDRSDDMRKCKRDRLMALIGSSSPARPSSMIRVMKVVVWGSASVRSSWPGVFHLLLGWEA